MNYPVLDSIDVIEKRKISRRKNAVAHAPTLGRAKKLHLLTQAFAL